VGNSVCVCVVLSMLGREQPGCVFAVPWSSEGSSPALRVTRTPRPSQQPSRRRRVKSLHPVWTRVV